MNASAWLPWSPPRTTVPDRVRLYCLPHGGGAASSFLPWSRSAAAAHLEIVPIELPGHATRISETPIDDMTELAEALYEDVFAAGHDEPFALFGHSMGGLLAYEVARLMTADGTTEPAVVFLSGSRTPGNQLPMNPNDLDDDGLIAKVIALGGVPDAIAAETELMRMLLPVFRSDFAALDNYQPETQEPLGSRVRAYAGTTDTLAEPDWVRRWSSWTTGSFSVRIFPGGHFFLQEHSDAVLADIVSELRHTSG